MEDATAYWPGGIRCGMETQKANCGSAGGERGVVVLSYESLLGGFLLLDVLFVGFRHGHCWCVEGAFGW